MCHNWETGNLAFPAQIWEAGSDTSSGHIADKQCPQAPPARPAVYLPVSVSIWGMAVMLIPPSSNYLGIKWENEG